MRSVLTTAIITICMVLTITVILTVNNYQVRKNETEEALAISMDQAMDALKFEDKEYTSANYQEFVSDLLQQIIFQVNSDGDVTINILRVDLDNGILDVEVVQTYKWAKMKKRVSQRRTIMLEEYAVDDDTNIVIDDDYVPAPDDNICTISFVADGATSTISVLYGEPVSKPADPVKSGWVFKGWYVQGDESRELLDDVDWADLCVAENITFVAMFAAE